MKTNRKIPQIENQEASQLYSLHAKTNVQSLFSFLPEETSPENVSSKFVQNDLQIIKRSGEKTLLESES